MLLIIHFIYFTINAKVEWLQALTIVGGTPASLRLVVDAQAFVTSLMLTVPGILPEQAVTPDQLSAWLGKPWETPTR